MKRREVLQSMGLASAHFLFPTVLTGFLTRCTQKEKEVYLPLFFTNEEYEGVARIIDVILPTTSTKAASEVETQAFLDEIFAKCFNEDQQKVMKEGLEKLIPEFESTDDKFTFLEEVDQKAFSGDEAYGFFMSLKQYTLVGFFTSQEGETKASNYVKIPGDYKGEIPLESTTLNYGETGLKYYL